jgi:suppressor of ftsI
MFHCHILEHEDKGMMAMMEVYDPRVGPLPDGPMPDMDHAGMVMPTASASSVAHAH